VEAGHGKDHYIIAAPFCKRALLQSAAGPTVCDAFVSPAAAGLFQKGISEQDRLRVRRRPRSVSTAPSCQSHPRQKADRSPARARRHPEFSATNKRQAGIEPGIFIGDLRMTMMFY
jgi:hypothetical protein